jgi:hypothetical protein
MFEFVISFIKDYRDKREGIVIDFIENFDEKKLSIVLTVLGTKMVSIEILPNGVCDLLAIEIQSEKTLDVKTETFSNNDDLKIGILNFLMKI